MSMDKDYRDYFIRNLHDALSGHSSNNVEEAVLFSEQSNTKCIGIPINFPLLILNKTPSLILKKQTKHQIMILLYNYSLLIIHY
jgi:hypothetical protein